MHIFDIYLSAVIICSAKALLVSAGATVVTELSPQLHCVVAGACSPSPDDDTRRLVTAALATGFSVVTWDWVEACMSSNELLKFDDFAILTAAALPVCTAEQPVKILNTPAESHTLRTVRPGSAQSITVRSSPLREASPVSSPPPDAVAVTAEPQPVISVSLVPYHDDSASTHKASAVSKSTSDSSATSGDVSAGLQPESTVRTASRDEYFQAASKQNTLRQFEMSFSPDPDPSPLTDTSPQEDVASMTSPSAFSHIRGPSYSTHAGKPPPSALGSTLFKVRVSFNDC